MFRKLDLGVANYPAIHNSSYQKHCLNVEDAKPSQEIQGSKLKRSDCRQAYIRFPAAILTRLSSLESLSVILEFSGWSNWFCFMIYLFCCFRAFGDSSNERRESTNVGQTMKSFTLYRYVFLWSKALFFLSCCLYWDSLHYGWQFTQTQKVMIHKEYKSIIPWYI